jgi:uncharacterized protein YyaL (SSP411 family)
VLEDHGDVAEGLLALYAATGETRWLGHAADVLDVVLDLFADAQGRLHDTGADAETLLRRPYDPTDNAAPSGTSAAAGALLTYASLTGSARHREAAERALALYPPLAREHPRFAGWALAVSEALADGPREVALVGGGDAEGATELARAVALATAPGLVVARGDGVDAGGVPLLEGRGTTGGRATAYVCRGFVCDLPTTDAARLADQLGADLGRRGEP